mgnify:CR=1 FL=1
MNNISLLDIEFPVFKLRSYNKIETIDNIIYVHTHWKSYVLDNKNLKGDTIGQRRSNITIGDVYPFKSVYKNPRDLVLSSKTGDTYCDNTGRVFKYQKSMRCPVVCFEIKTYLRVGSKIIIHLKEYPAPQVIPSSAFDPDYKYITLAKYGEYYLLYSLEKEYIKPFTKKL